MSKLMICEFIDESTNAVTYIVADKASNQAAVIDSLLEFDPSTGKTSTRQADNIIALLDQHQLELEWVLETKLHTDHVTAAHYLKTKCGGLIGVSEHIKTAPNRPKKSANCTDIAAHEVNAFDYFFEDGEVVYLGHLQIVVLQTPGLCPTGVCYKIEDAIFVGDLMHMASPENNLQTGNSHANTGLLNCSIQRILSLPELTRVFVGHPITRSKSDITQCETTILEEKRRNKYAHLKTPRSLLCE